MQKLIFLIVFISLGFTLFAQNRKILTPDGKLHSINEVKRVKQFNKTGPQTIKINSINNINGTIDTLQYPGPWDSNFGFFGQDWFLGWFECPADLTIKQVGFACYENLDNMSVEVKIVKVNWTKEELMTAGVAWRGYYPGGYNDITAFLDNPDRTGPWVSIDGSPEPFGNDIWSFSGMGFPITPVGNNPPVYQWVPMNALFEPDLLAGDIFGIAIKHTGPTMDANRLGMWAGGSVGIPSWKFYMNGRLDPGVDVGWWTREYTWNFVAEVLLTGDVPPEFLSYTQLITVYSTEPRNVTAEIIDDNPSGGPVGVASAALYYSINGGQFIEVSMTNIIGTTWEGTIPGYELGTEVEYYLSAIDVEGNTATTPPIQYRLFLPEERNLVVYNGYDENVGYPVGYYFPGGWYPYPDTWHYGALTDDLVDHYDNIIEIATNGPKVYNDYVVRTWLEGDAERNYFLCGMQWLGLKNNFVDSHYVAGNFEYDILGIEHSYNNISSDGGGDELLPTRLFAQEESRLGGSLYNAFTSLGTDSLQHDPFYELSTSANAIHTIYNWQDAFDALPDVEVDIEVETRYIENLPNVQVLPTGGHRTLPAGNKIAFFALDPLAINSAPVYNWFGHSVYSPLVQTLEWFDVFTSAPLKEDLNPKEYILQQNYPNPFNPATTIEYATPEIGLVELTVYDILGRELAVLVNQEQLPGKYKVKFNSLSVSGGQGLASGVYFYQLKTNGFIKSMKMLLIK